MNDNENNFSRHLSAYLDGELDSRHSARVEKALAVDPQLASELEGLRRTRNLLHNLPCAEAPDDFVSHVLAKAERARLMAEAPQQQTPVRYGWVRHLASAAVVLILASAALLVWWQLWGDNSFTDNNPGTGVSSSTPPKKSSDESKPTVTREIAFAEEMVLVSENPDYTSAAIREALLENGFAAASGELSVDSEPAERFFQARPVGNGRREVVVYYHSEADLLAVRSELKDIRSRQAALQLNHQPRTVAVHIRHESHDGREVRFYERKTDKAEHTLAVHLARPWGDLAMSADPEEVPIGFNGTRMSDGLHGEKSPEREAYEMIRKSLAEMKEDSGLTPEHEPLLVDDDDERIAQAVRNSLADIDRRVDPASRTHSAATGENRLRVLVVTVLDEVEARSLTESE
ncbi:MAG: anti-sigma factor family protein [Phycisphaerae bacterium]